MPPIQCHEPEDGVFFAQIGPTGGSQGYASITGHVGWGIGKKLVILFWNNALLKRLHKITSIYSNQKKISAVCLLFVF